MAQASIVGRDEELASVVASLDSGMRPSALLLEGEAGIGKTTLWEEAVAAARRSGFRVLACRPGGTETQLSYAALGDLLEEALDEVLPELPSPQRRALEAALLLEEPEEARLDRRAVSVAFLNAVRHLESGGAVAIAIDDLHWLDPETASAVEYAARRLGDRRVALILARRAEPHEPAPLGLARTLSPEQLERLWIGPLSLGAVHHLLQAQLHLFLPRPRLRRLHELSGGNPFYALELGRALDRGTIRLEPGEPLPATLQELVSERLAGLPESTRVELAAAAALSRPTLAAVDANALEPAVQARVIEIVGDEVRFSHPLLRTAAYAHSSVAERRALHRRLADAAADVEERARHLALATDEPNEPLAQAVEDGALAAFRRGAPGAAAELAARARQLTPPDKPVETRRRALAEAEYRFETGDPASAAALLEETLASAPSGPERAQILSLLARVHHFGADVGGGAELLRQALAEAGDDPVLRTQIEEGLAWSLLLMREDLPAAAEHARSAVRFAEQLGDRAALAEALAAQALAEFALGRDATPTMERALALEEWTLHLRVLRHPSFAHGYLLSCSDEFAPAREVFFELQRRATDQGDESALAPILNHLTLVECLAGNWDEAARHAEEGHSLAFQSGQGPTQASILAKRALLEALRGEVDDSRATADRSLEIAVPTGFDPSTPGPALARGGETAISALGFLELSLGRPEEAHRYLGPLAAALLAAGLEEPGELRCLPDEIEALVSLDRLEDADRLLAPLEETAGRLDRSSVLALTGRCRALLLAGRGDVPRALAVLEGALEQHDRRPLPFERARTLLALGQVQRRAKQRRAARDSLSEALADFEALGAGLWAERARAELRRIGGRASSAGKLTPTERHLAELVAEGRSNKEAAAALFVTPKTVETQLSRIYAKLGIHSRAELARRLSESKL